MSTDASHLHALAAAGPRRRHFEPHALAIAAIGLPLTLMVLGLGSYRLLNNNEGLYAEIAREMAQGGSWIIPHLNGVPYIEKPPLVYWLAALLLRGDDAPEFLVRLVPAAAGALTLAFTWWFAAGTLGRRVAWLAVLVLGSCVGFLAMSRVVMLDMWLTAMLTAALYASHALMHRPGRAVRIATGMTLALAVLAKGWIAVLLFALVVATYVLALERGRRAQALQRLRAPSLWLTFAVIALPWHIAATLELREFAWFYFVNEHVLRFLGLREPHDYYGGPAWYYLPRLALALLPWTFLLFVRRRSTRETATTNDTARFLRIASLVPLALLSFSSAKANYYAILCVPPLAILVALNVVTLARERRVRGFAFRVGAVVATFAAISFASLHYGLLTDVQSWIPPSALLVAAIVCLGTAAVGLAAANRWSAACVAVALISLPVTAFTVVVLKAEEPALSARAWIDAHEDLAAQQSWIFADFEAFSAVPFYAGTPVPVIDSRSRDLAFAQRLGYGEGMFVRSRDIPAPARGLVWYERRRQGELEATAIASRLSPLGCAGEQCVAALEPAKE